MKLQGDKVNSNLLTQDMNVGKDYTHNFLLDVLEYNMFIYYIVIVEKRVGPYWIEVSFFLSSHTQD